MKWKLVPSVPRGGVVRPDERLPWLQTFFIGLQQVIAMFGATFIVPLQTGFPPTTTLVFSGIGTVAFLRIVKNRIPSYLGSSFAFIAPVVAAKGAGNNIGLALGGIVTVGVALMLVGWLVNKIGHEWINWLMPPAVTTAVVMLIGLNLAPAAVGGFQSNWAYAAMTTVTIMIAATIPGFAKRTSIFIGVVIAWAVAYMTGGVDPEALQAVSKAAWIGLPEFNLPQFDWKVSLFMLPLLLPLLAENTGHVKAVGTMTGDDLDKYLGRAYIGDGFATMLAGCFGGSGTTTYAENIGVMGATRIYSTAAFYVAAAFAILLGMSPKVGAVLLTMPKGVLGGATVMLYGYIAYLGLKIWNDNKVEFTNYNVMPGAVGVTIGAGSLLLPISHDLSIAGIVLGTIVVIGGYHMMKTLDTFFSRFEKQAEPHQLDLRASHPAE